MDREIISRSDAIAQGLDRYFTGKPCKHGHISERRADARACLECVSVYHAAWYQANKARKDAATAAWAKANPKKRVNFVRKWQAKNPEKAKAYTAEWYASRDNRTAHAHRRRARKAGGGGKHTATDLRQILEAQDHKCIYCRVSLRNVRKHVDHIHPLALGGSNDKSNLQYLCAPCNLSKGAKDPVQFAQERGLLL